MKPLLTVKIQADCSPEQVRAAFEAGAVAGKIYPEGLTTNSSNGISKEMFFNAPKNFADTLGEMERLGMILCVHGEMPGYETLKREIVFLGWIGWVMLNYPKLKVVLEHITNKQTVEFITKAPGNNLAATITVHHLLLTLDDIIGDKLNPHHFCKPVPKMQEDRSALQAAAVSGDPRFFLGTDSAPHLRGNKECSQGCAGVYTAPVATELMVEMFDALELLPRISGFMTEFGQQFYNLPSIEGEVALTKESWKVPEEFDGIVPLWAGKECKWRLDHG